LLPPEKVVEYYGKRGYSVIVLTDHGKITRVKNRKDLLVVPGVELSCGRTLLGEPYHILAVGLDDERVLRIRDVQEVIDYINSGGGIAIVAHPYWSGAVHQDLVKLRGFTAIEIFNYGCEVEVSKGFSLHIWDSLLTRGVKVWGVAVDDAHRYLLPPLDADGGWVVVHAEDVDLDHVLKSLKEGRFYSSTGPAFTKIRYDHGVLEVETEGVKRISVISSNGRGLPVDMNTIKWLSKIDERNGYEISINNVNSDGLCITVSLGKTSIETHVEDDRIKRLVVENGKWEGYIRLEVADARGRKAWSNPIFL